MADCLRSSLERTGPGAVRGMLEPRGAGLAPLGAMAKAETSALERRGPSCASVTASGLVGLPGWECQTLARHSGDHGAELGSRGPPSCSSPALPTSTALTSRALLSAVPL